jgi:antibiotic biosynthesis monooxygenase (ABM) superfamily enzyme
MRADEPVTVLIRRRVRAGREAGYEAALRRLQAEAHGLPGYLGVTTQPPAANGPREYLSAVRFASLADLRAFESGPLRQRFLAEVQPFVEGDAAWTELTGLEFWFSAPAGTVVPQPSRPRMALVMVAVVFVLVLTIGTAVDAAFAQLPFATPAPLRLLVTIALEVAVMTWWLMPVLTRRLAPWIYPQRRTA